MTRGLWERETVALMLLAALMPMALIWLWMEGAEAFLRLFMTLLVAGFWHLLFMLARAQPPSFAGAVSALAIAILAPNDFGILQLTLGISFGVVVGELIFGGWGRNVVNPATVALSFLGFGFPAYAWPDLFAPLAWAALPAAVIGLATGVMAPGVIGGAVLVGIGAGMAGTVSSEIYVASSVVLLLLVADPVASASTRPGRWLNGALYAALVWMFALWWDDAAPVQMAVAAALLVSLAAPVLDEAAIAIWLIRRRRRLGKS